MVDLILHHYDFSNYAEKVRLALGYKSLTWHSVTIPSVAPKPELQQLTGGYRRTPVLQIGADIYCDTQLILRTLERLQPEPTFFPKAYKALAQTVSHWSETQLFRPISLYVSGSNPDAFPLSLQADRARMRGLPPPNAVAMKRAAGRNAPLVRTQLPLIEEMLSDGRQWILGPETTIADFSIYHALWFITGRTKLLAFELEPFQGIRSWMQRMAAFGHGTNLSMTPQQALEIATVANPRPVAPSHPFGEDPPVGKRVRVRASDYGKDAVEGTLVMIDPHVITISRNDATLGEIYVHFPRLGYELRERQR
ncbi:MAG: glutathione S-transferase family protein [Alphaproteobacteria bacterium]|nr:glutathione S-transferase family protein [Alphaproteobacteria bacterium]